MKSGVTKANRYEPDINPVYLDFAKHYDTVILPARPHSPKDKAMVENAVKTTYNRIFAPKRDRIFYCLEELNESIREQLDKHNNMSFQRTNKSRFELFNEIEKEALKSLPKERYEYKEFLSLKVQFNYHIYLGEDRHYYSVPWQYKGKRVTVIYSSRTVEIYHKNIRIAFHKRDRRINGYTTLKEHMPPHHRFYKEWSPQRMINWAEKVGDDVKSMVEKILENRKYPEQAFKVCPGILSLSRKYDPQRLNRACVRALQFNYYSYKAVKNILEKNLDRIEEDSTSWSLPLHKNIRGDKYFN